MAIKPATKSKTIQQIKAKNMVHLPSEMPLREAKKIPTQVNIVVFHLRRHTR
jgi:hypothetical protein